MNAAVTIRPAQAKDRAFVRDLGRRVSETSTSSLRPGEPELVAEAYDRLVDYVLTRDHAIVVAIDADGDPLGFAMVVYDLPEEVTLGEQAFLAYMAVEPEHRRRGVGRALLDDVAAAARERGVPYLSLMVTDENAGARALYEAAGMRTERRLMTVAL